MKCPLSLEEIGKIKRDSLAGWRAGEEPGPPTAISDQAIATAAYRKALEWSLRHGSRCAECAAGLKPKLYEGKYWRHRKGEWVCNLAGTHDALAALTTETEQQ